MYCIYTIHDTPILFHGSTGLRDNAECPTSKGSIYIYIYRVMTLHRSDDSPGQLSTLEFGKVIIVSEHNFKSVLN